MSTDEDDEEKTLIWSSDWAYKKHLEDLNLLALPCCFFSSSERCEETTACWNVEICKLVFIIKVVLYLFTLLIGGFIN